jgi:hypothetical protein
MIPFCSKLPENGQNLTRLNDDSCHEIVETGKNWSKIFQPKNGKPRSVWVNGR